ncbi:MAG TPA: hypothetical protein VGK47_03735 [Nitrososphaeraceae archaeon]
MTSEELKAKQAEMPDAELIEKVDAQISELCRTGARSFIMCVPPRITDTDMLLSEMVRRFKARSASPQQGTEGAEEVLDKVCKSVPYIWGSNAEQSELLLPKKLALKAMHQFAQSQVEQAVKEKDGELVNLDMHYRYMVEGYNKQKATISQLEAALKVQTEHVADLMASSLVRPELVVPSENENVLAEEFLELVAMAQRMQVLYRNGRYILSDKELLDITDYLSEIQRKKPQ